MFDLGPCYALQILQKKAVRALVGATYNANTSPIFKKLEILRISDLIDLEQAKLSYKFVHNELPPGISKLFLPNAFNHRYNTRAGRNPRVAKHKIHIIHKSFLIKSPTIWSNLPLNIMDHIPYKNNNTMTYGIKDDEFLFI